MDFVNNILSNINSILYTHILIALLIGAGLYFTLRTKFVQIRLLSDAFKSLSEKAGGGRISSFQALMISTASRVGTGNIAGVTTCLVAGGPGSLFWMWLMALFGGASAFVESTLAQVYKTKSGKGFRGGPSYYIQKAFGHKWAGILFSFLLIICFSYGFNALQSYNMSSSFEYYFDDYSHTIAPIIVGVIISVIVGITIFGGVKRISLLTSYVVPFMAIVYIILGLAITVTNFHKIPDVFSLIFREAFNFRAIFGSFAGSAILLGTKRGLFSNEAGMGSAPNAAATADVAHPVKQGMAQVLSVFIDTMMICTTTGFIVLLSDQDLKCGLDGIPFIQGSVSHEFGIIGVHFITFSIFSFATTAIIGNYYYAESNLLFIKNDKRLLNLFRCTCIVAVFLGAQAQACTVWNIADILMGLMAILNIVTILFLGRVALKTLDDYMRQKKEGKDPVFIAKNAGIDNTELWK